MKFKSIAWSLLGLISIAGGSLLVAHTHASDHDDGSQSQRDNTLNLTDLFAFREDNQTGAGADSANLMLIMNSHGHTPAGQQAFFNTGAYYDFHLTRVTSANVDTTPSGKDDNIIRFSFGDPDAKQRQPVTVSMVIDGKMVNSTQTIPAFTTSLADAKAGEMKLNTLSWPNGMTTAFSAGLREDPFFFDVDQFFKVRAGAAGLGPLANFRSPEEAVDGFAKQNVNSIIVRQPIAMLQTSANEPVFDIWETTTLKK